MCSLHLKKQKSNRKANSQNYEKTFLNWEENTYLFPVQCSHVINSLRFSLSRHLLMTDRLFGTNIERKWFGLSHIKEKSYAVSSFWMSQTLLFPAERDLSDTVAFSSRCHLDCCHSFPPRCVKSLTSSRSMGETRCLLRADLVAQSTWLGNPVLREHMRSSNHCPSKTLLEVWKSWVNFILPK